MATLRRILVTGATGKQGGSLISAMLASQPAEAFHLVALTRDAKSSRAKALASKPNVSVIEGDLDNVDAIFRQSKEPFYGVYSVQSVTTPEIEEKAGKALVDAAIANQVQHFVYSSVDRGGPHKSDIDPTPIPHFIAKHNIELHLKAATSQTATNMKWTILRPVAFMDNFTNDFVGRAFASMWELNGMDNKLQFVACKDIGIMAADAFKRPEQFSGRAISLATDEVDPREADAIFRKVTGKSMPETYPVIARVLKWYLRQELGIMMDWFKSTGYGASPAEIRKEYPQMQTFETWLRESGGFRKH